MLKNSLNITKILTKNEKILAQLILKSSNSTTTTTTKTTSTTSSNVGGVENSGKKSIEGEEKLANTDFGLLFDIDGVLVRGKTLLPRTRECIKLITDSNGYFKIPTVFVTNAGNELRSTKSAKLSNLLGVYIDPTQVVMSHSPLKLFKQFHNKRCLVSGQGPIAEIAKNLGFKSLITIDDLRQYYPYLDVVDHKRRNFAVSQKIRKSFDTIKN